MDTLAAECPLQKETQWNAKCLPTLEFTPLGTWPGSTHSTRALCDTGRPSAFPYYDIRITGSDGHPERRRWQGARHTQEGRGTFSVPSMAICQTDSALHGVWAPGDLSHLTHMPPTLLDWERHLTLRTSSWGWGWGWGCGGWWAFGEGFFAGPLPSQPGAVQHK